MVERHRFSDVVVEFVEQIIQKARAHVSFTFAGIDEQRKVGRAQSLFQKRIVEFGIGPSALVFHVHEVVFEHLAVVAIHHVVLRKGHVALGKPLKKPPKKHGGQFRPIYVIHVATLKLLQRHAVVFVEQNRKAAVKTLQIAGGLDLLQHNLPLSERIVGL